MLSNTIMGMRMVHFEKILAKDHHKMEENRAGRINKYFCSCGYYDRMTYVRAVDKSLIMDYKHCFLIKYPYQHREQQLIADQMFTLLMTDVEEKDKQKDDPFEFEQTGKAPFLGIILVTIGTKLESTDNVKYSSLLEAYKNLSIDILREEVKEPNGCYKVFYTPNCADLCIVIRTNMIKKIYNVKKKLSVKTLEEYSSGICYTTSYTMFQVSDQQWSDKIVDDNKILKIELRLSGKEAVMQSISEYCRNCDSCNVYGITGNGQYSVELDFATFASIYPLLCNIKVRNEDASLKCESELQTIFLKNLEDIECSYIRVNYEPQFMPEENSENEPCDDMDLKFITEYEQRIKDCICQKAIDDISLGNYLREQKTLLRELLYTYNDLWFRQSSWWKGLVFYSQLESILLGVAQYEKLINELDVQTNRAALTKQTCKDLAQAISNVNNFNKLLQSVNQYVVNVPNYEMQTKVNVEKYLLAYTMYLFEISNNYYREHKVDGVDRIYPLFTIDFTAPGMQAHTLFGAITVMESQENLENWTTLFTVECPNHQWFANIYHVLPMITHEMSHNFRYLERKERNKFVFRFLSGQFAKYLANILLPIVTDNFAADFNGSREKFFVDNIRNTLQKEMDGYIEAEGTNIKLRDIGVYSRKKFLEIVGYNEEMTGESQLWDKVGKEMLEIYKICNVNFLSPEDIGKNKITKDNIYEIRCNVLLDLLMDNTDTMAVCEKWSEELQKLKSASEDTQFWIDDIMEILKQYQIQKEIPVLYIQVVIDYAIDYWMNNDVTLMKLRKENTRIRSCIDALQERNINKALKALSLNETSCVLEENSGLKPVGEFTLYCEKLNKFCHCYANVFTSIQWNAVDVIMPRKGKAKEFAESLHNSMNYTYGTMLKDRGKEENQWITYQEEQKILASMGVIDSKCNQFWDNYKAMLQRISPDALKAIIDDSLRLYQEVFADYGMCKAFSFSPYGYFMYCIHIFMKQREVPEVLARNLTSDRIRTLFLTLYKNELNEFKQKLGEYWNELKKHLDCEYKGEYPEKLQKLCEITDFFQLKKTYISEALRVMNSHDENLKNKELIKYLEMLRWMVIFYEELRLEDEVDNDEDCLTKEFYEHICDVDIKVGKDDDIKELWIRRCRNNEQLKKIGEYYNDFTYTNIWLQNVKGDCLNNQNAFVFHYYGKMFDCFHYVKNQLKNIPQNDFDIMKCLFEYEIGEEGEESESKCISKI